jgi:hypothetical protein
VCGFVEAWNSCRTSMMLVMDSVSHQCSG